MKRLKFYLLTALTVLGLSSALHVNAQNWNGHAPSNNLKVVLYNVGSGMYLCGGNTWGTQTTLMTTAQYFNLSGSDKSGYQFKNGSRGIGYGSDDPNGLYVDGGTVVTFAFKAVEGKSKTYYLEINNGNGSGDYLIAPSMVDAGGNRTGIPGGKISYAPKTDGDEFAQWILVTEEDRQSYFAEVANANNLSAQTTDGTFLIGVPDFARKDNNIQSSWKTDLTAEPANWSWSGFDDNTNVYTPSRSSACAYIGNGYGGRAAYHSYYTTMKADKDLMEIFKEKDVEEEDKMDKYLGGLWTANLHGKGYLQQDITVKKSGWYEISCVGFTTGSAQLIATTKNAADNTTVLVSEEAKSLTKVAALPFSTYAHAGYELQKNPATYKQAVRIYVDLKGADSGVLTVKIQETSKGTSKVLPWACVDDFTLTYYGEDVEPYFYFDELETNLDELKNQITDQKHTLYLHRSLKSGQWGSLILPVDVYAKNIKTAFGAQTILSELEGVSDQNDYLIKFKKINLDVASNKIEAGKLYIIKPQGNMGVLSYGKHEFDRVDNTASPALGESVGIKHLTNVESSETRPIFRIRNVGFNQLKCDNNGMVVINGYPHGTGNVLQALQFKGIYIQKEENGLIPAGSFVLGASDGQWYHTTSAINTIKGFRTWMDTTNVPANAKISFSINGVVEDGNITAIDGIETDKSQVVPNIYDLNGRMVRSNGSIEGLAKGIYIVNGKKVVIK